MTVDHMVIRMENCGVTVIGPFKERDAAERYRKRRVKFLREEEDRGVTPQGCVAFFTAVVYEPMPSLMDEEAKTKTCGCCEHGE